MARKEEDWIDLGQEQVPFAALLQSSRNQTGSKGPDHVALFPDKDPDRQEESLLTLKVRKVQSFHNTRLNTKDNFLDF